MEAMAREWSDDRLDALNEKVERGFKQVDKQFEKVDADMRELRSQIAAMQRTMTQGVIGLAGVMVTGFVTLATMIVLVQA